MKKPYILALASALMFFGPISVSAQSTLFMEDFETENVDTKNNPSRPVGAEEGWTTIDSYQGSNMQYKWSNYYSENGTIGGTHVAMCDAPMVVADDPDAAQPREEILLSPELTLNNTYQLSFSWKVSPQAVAEKTKYDLQVRVVVDGDVKNAETIFSIQNKQDLIESGVTEYPISTWSTKTSKLDLSKWKGKTIKLAFVYKMFANAANIVYLDDIKVKKFTPATGPVGKLNATSYDFGKVYIGEKFYSDEFTLTNTGLAGLKINSVDLPTGVGITIDPKTVDLGKNEAVKFRLSYTASLTAPAQNNVVLHTTGGDLTIALTANKEGTPQGMTEETFENGFPPAGWKTVGWSKSNGGLEGDVSAMASVDYSDQYLTSPRLDLTKGGKVQFTYHNSYDYEADQDGNVQAQANDITVELSTDGGKTWVEKWKYDYKKLDFGETITVDLGKGTDNSYIRWHNTAVTTSTDGDVAPCSTFYLDRVFLPTLYGQDGVPFATTLVSPENGKKEVYNKNIELKWTKAQFADGYKVYVGKSDTDFSFVNGVDVKDATSYTLPVADYETTYSWKVVPYNAKGDAAEATVWHFTTQKDASNSTYPYAIDFSGVSGLPTGWTSSTTSSISNRTWSVLSLSGNPAPCLYNMWLDKGVTSEVTTPEFKLTAGKQMSISFDWVDCHPNSATIDQLGNAKKHNVEGAPTTVKFEIFADGTWTELSRISQGIDTDEAPAYWINEKFNLAAYAGKTVQFRWTHIANNGNDGGCGIDNVVVEENENDKATFNKEGWNAGKVNYNKAVKSGDKFTMFNKGEQTLKVKSVSFDTDNFESTIAAGTEIAKGESLTFSVQFNAKDAAAVVKDNMTVTFESGYSVKFPVEGTALAKDVLYYSFEDNYLDCNWEKDFTLIDVDKAATTPFKCYGTEFDKSGTVFAFAVAYERPDHNNVAPISGDAFLVAASAVDGLTKGDNWIVSTKLKATANSKFDFYARNWDSKESIVPDAQHQISVLVSETSNTDRNSFTAVLPLQDMPLLERNNWNHYQIDLSAYAGKDIYVAVRDYTEKYAQAAFFDDFTFSGFDEFTTGIGAVESEVAADGAVSVYNLNGMMVAQGNGKDVLNGLSKGIYVVKVQTANGVKTMKVALK